MFNYDKITFIENQLNNIQVIFTNSSAKDTFAYEFLDSKGDVIDTPEDITVNLTKSVGRCPSKRSDWLVVGSQGHFQNI